MRFLIMLEQTESGFAVQVPDLAIVAHAESLDGARHAAAEAIRINLAAYSEAGQPVPERQAVYKHLENPAFRELLFAYVEIAAPDERVAA